MVEQNKGSVLITGASTGIGRATALLLDRSGYRVFAGVRKQQAGEGLRIEASERLTPVILDITNQGHIASALQMVTRVLGPKQGLAGLVNNAGMVVAGPLEFVPLDSFRYQLEVNLLGHIAVTQAFLPLIRKGHGRILNIGTAGWRFFPPFLGPYISTKVAVECLTHALRRELRPWKIPVAVVEPGAIATDIWERGMQTAIKLSSDYPPEAHEMYGRRFTAGQRAIQELGRHAIPSERAARVVLRALESRRMKIRYFIGPHAYLSFFITKFIPYRLVDWMSERLLEKHARQG